MFQQTILKLLPFVKTGRSNTGGGKMEVRSYGTSVRPSQWDARACPLSLIRAPSSKTSLSSLVDTWIRMGNSPDGKALKFVHRGSYDNMDNTYEAITNHLDDKKLEAKDTFIEEYITDPLKTAEDRLVINVYVPLK